MSRATANHHRQQRGEREDHEHGRGDGAAKRLIPASASIGEHVAEEKHLAATQQRGNNELSDRKHANGNGTGDDARQREGQRHVEQLLATRCSEVCRRIDKRAWHSRHGDESRKDEQRNVASVAAASVAGASVAGASVDGESELQAETTATGATAPMVKKVR